MSESEVYYPVQVHRLFDGNRYYFFAFHPDFGASACSATGDTIEEALELLDKVRQEVITYLRDKGKPIPKVSEHSFCAGEYGGQWERSERCAGIAPISSRIFMSEDFPCSREVREPVVWFSGEMEKALAANDAQYEGNSWGEALDSVLLQRLLEEVAEVVVAMDLGDKSDVIKECADVANFAMMLADNRRPEKG